MSLCRLCGQIFRLKNAGSRNIINFRDCKGFPNQDYSQDMKFWWPQTEAIIATLYAYLASGNELGMYEIFAQSVDAELDLVVERRIGYHAAYRGKLSELALTILDWSWEWGWDKEFGGIINFRDCKGFPNQDYSQDMTSLNRASASSA